MLETLFVKNIVFSILVDIDELWEYVKIFQLGSLRLIHLLL